MSASIYKNQSVAILAGRSVKHFADLVSAKKLHLNQSRVGKIYDIRGAGKYEVFRESDSNTVHKEQEAVLVVGFKLKVINESEQPHQVFQRVCVLTTPFWSGFEGFGTKLWMVSHENKSYLGVYRWFGKDKAQVYVDALIKILRPLSVSGSVWYSLYPRTNMEDFLDRPLN
jgi:hypothetical protein